VEENDLALSSDEAKYHILMENTKEDVWLMKLSTKIGLIKPRPTTLFCNNISNIKMAKNAILHAWTKHIECHYHFVHEKVLSNEIDIKHVQSCQQQADLLTKPLGRTKFEGL
jgi:hypothetical protein